MIAVKEIQTPLGLMIAGANDEGLHFIEFTTPENRDALLAQLSKELKLPLEFSGHTYLAQLEEELNAYFNKRMTGFTVPLALTGSDFQKSVWRSLLEIPYGKRWTYKQQALHLGQLPAIRAMASANGQNRHAIVIPCHRVIGSDGGITGYAGGIHKKKWLLDFESDKAGQTLEIQFE